MPSFKHFNTGGHCAQQSAEWTVLSMANGHRVALFGIMAPWSEVVGSGRKIFCRLVLRRASNVSHPKRHVHRQGHRYKEATNYCHSPAPKYDPPRSWLSRETLLSTWNSSALKRANFWVGSWNWRTRSLRESETLGPGKLRPHETTMAIQPAIQLNQRKIRSL